MVNAFLDFSGQELTFSVSGPGVHLDPATGRVTIPGEALVAGIEVVVVATGSGGGAESRFRLSVASMTPPVKAPAVTGSLADLALVLGTAALVDAGAAFSGSGLVYAVSGGGAEIDAGGTITLPADRPLSEEPVTVTAQNAAGTATLVFRISVVAAPAVTGSLADLALVLGTAALVDAGAAFSGGGLVYAVSGGGAEIDAGGTITLPADRPLSEEPVTVTAQNAAGTATLVFRISVVAAPAVTGSLADLALVLGTAALVDAGAAFSGSGLVYAVSGGGAEIDAGGTITLPADRPLSEEPVTVTAQNAAGTATLVFRISVVAAPILPAAPVAQGTLADLLLTQGSGVLTVSTQAGFLGEDLVFALVAAPAGVSIETGSGLLRVATDAPLASARVTVRASNAAGAAEQGFALTVRSTASVFTGVAVLAEVAFLAYAAPAWTLQAEGFARLVPAAAGRTHGAWSKAAGDGRYRCLARWSAPKITGVGARPFSFGVRLAKVKPGWAGLKVDVLQPSASGRQLEIAQYVSGETKAPALATAEVGWQWDNWYWVEVEVDGPAIRARLYPETAAAPDWQVGATTSFTDAGAFGPGGFPLSTGGPSIDIRRLEYVPLILGSDGVPPAAADADWSLGQFTESK